jgi:hypothetical protein
MKGANTRNVTAINDALLTHRKYMVYPLAACGKRGMAHMPRRKNSEVTSAKAASAASKVLRNPKSSKAAKTAAASALTQRPNKKG